MRAGDPMPLKGDLLVLDDLGADLRTPTRVGRLERFAERVYAKSMPIIVTSNYDRMGLAEEIYRVVENETTARRIVERFGMGATFVEVGGKSRRVN
jgi:hypothetical protein